MIAILDSQLNDFPQPKNADENGLLAIGGDLSVHRLLTAYQQGIFPWYNPGDPICWFSPDPRCVIFPSSLKISKSMRKLRQQNVFSYSYNEAFEMIIKHCASVDRKDQDGTWISSEMQKAYIELNKLGYAHSIEVWNKENHLVGGLYGVLIGKIFVGESMFSHESNASKAALIELAERFDLELIDCQVPNSHLMSLGATLLSREEYLNTLSNHTPQANGLQKLLRHT